MSADRVTTAGTPTDTATTTSTAAAHRATAPTDATATTGHDRTGHPHPQAARSRAFDVLVGLTSVVVLLQGLWAGMFLQGDDRDAFGQWIDVHARGGELAIGLAVIAAVIGVVKLRSRVDLWGGALALGVLLVLEAYVGGLIRDDGLDQLTPLHVPLGMALFGLAVWLPMRARRRGDVHDDRR